MSSKTIKNDTLLLTIYMDNKGWNLQAYRHSFTFRNDTLSLNLNDTNRIIRTTVYNKSNHKTEIYITRKMTFYTLNGGSDIQRIQYTLTGFEKVPKAFKFNDSDLCDCPTKPVRFEIWKNDTINMINANGYKQGNWLEFYDTGEIQSKREYKNGQFVVGYNYDKKGKATYKLEKNAELELATPIEQIK